jgi:hypothetical protein
VRAKFILQALAALIVGYVMIVLLTSLGFNGVLGGRALYGGSPQDLAAGMLVAVISGLAGGYAAGWVGPARGLTNAAFVLLPLAMDTTFVLFFAKTKVAPVWFDALASATLMACTLAGGFLRERWPVARKAGKGETNA